MTFTQRQNTRINELDFQLLSAVATRKIHKAEKALLSGAYIETHELQMGQSPLQMACVIKHRDMVDLLLRHGANVNSPNFLERTPIHETAANGNLEIAQTLVRHGADLNALDNDGNPPHFYTIIHPKIAIFEYFIELGANLKQQNFYGQTILDYFFMLQDKSVEHGQLALRIYQILGWDPVKTLFRGQTLSGALEDSPKALQVIRQYIADQTGSQLTRGNGGATDKGGRAL
jgi:Ankyrin repeats (many copies)